jgi:leader peptidase (prepilin peptidase)/N-methyltransferase
LFNIFSDPVSSITGAIAGYLFLWTIYQLFKLFTGKEGMGYGDFKLLALFGAWLGPGATRA